MLSRTRQPSLPPPLSEWFSVGFLWGFFKRGFYIAHAVCSMYSAKGSNIKRVFLSLCCVFIAYCQSRGVCISTQSTPSQLLIMYIHTYLPTFPLSCTGSRATLNQVWLTWQPRLLSEASFLPQRRRSWE